MVTGGIDYDILAERIVGIMTGENAPKTKGENSAMAELTSMERKIDELRNTLNGAVSVKQMPEFKKLDGLIADYLRTLSYDTIPDMLIAANAVKDLANRYIVSGNSLRGETMLSDLRMRLERVNVWGTNAIAAISDAVASHNLPVTYSKEAMEAFRAAVLEFEQSPALPSDELAQKLLRAKQTLLCDADLESMDKETLEEILEIREEVGDGVPDAGKVANLSELKKELMSFNLSYFVDLTPALPNESAPASAAVDTQTILDAIARLAAAPAPAAPQEKCEAPSEANTEEIRAKLNEIAASRPAAPAKKRNLRPAVSSKDNKVDKAEQPLRIVRRSIHTDENPDSLSKEIADQLAEKIADGKAK